MDEFISKVKPHIINTEHASELIKCGYVLLPVADFNHMDLSRPTQSPQTSFNSMHTHKLVNTIDRYSKNQVSCGWLSFDDPLKTSNCRIQDIAYIVRFCGVVVSKESDESDNWSLVLVVEPAMTENGTLFKQLQRANALEHKIAIQSVSANSFEFMSFYSSLRN